MAGKIYYMVGDYPHPSWGIGMIYHHVRLLRQLGLEAFVLHHKRPFRIEWLDICGIPMCYREPDGFDPHPQDLLVVPEVLVNEALELESSCRRLVFVQGSYIMLANLPTARPYSELGFESAITVMPHIVEIIETHFGVRADVIPPLIAPYFFSDDGGFETSIRQKQILLCSKSEYGQAGYLDHDIFCKLIKRNLPPDWRLISLEQMHHREVALTMQSSAIMVNLNLLESFNATVPEAMAAGCLVVCYDAGGGRDFLVDGQNAFVFSNNDIYPLVDKVIDLVNNGDLQRPSLKSMRTSARETANQYRESQTKVQLDRCYRRLMSIDPQ